MIEAQWYRRRLLASVAWAMAVASIAVSIPLLTIDLVSRIQPYPSLSRFEMRSPFVVDDKGKLLRAFLSEDEKWRLLLNKRDIPKFYLEMLIDYEDKRFYRHSGVDYIALMRAVWQFARNGTVVSGASTITMQTARLLNPGRMSLARKFRQIVAAVQLERRFSKSEIINIYLTLAPFGGNIEGLRAASLIYFSKEPKFLNRSEAALLIALPQAPERRRLDRRLKHALQARDRVLARATSRTSRGVDQAPGETSFPRRDLLWSAPHLAERLRSQAPSQEAISTYIDSRLQINVERLAKEALCCTPSGVNAALLVVRNRDSAIIAYVGGAQYGASASAGHVDLVQAVRSPGSALKPYVYGLAFEERLLHPKTIVTDAPVQYGDYEPLNFMADFSGDMTVRESIIRSVNTTPVNVLSKLGPDKLLIRLRSVGAPLKVERGDDEAGLAIALGGAGISLFQLTRLYSALANGGRIANLRLTKQDRENDRQQLLSADAVWALTDIMADMPPPPGFSPAIATDGGRRIAYKTGTSYGFRDAWSVGYDQDYTVGVWVGRPDGAPHLEAYGVTAAAPILFRIFDNLPSPEGDVAGPPPLDSVLGQSVDLPERLRRFSAVQNTDVSNRPLRLLFPKEASTLLLAKRKGALTPLPLSIDGGYPPYTWYVDNIRIAQPSRETVVYWTPQGPGAAKVEVFDSLGKQAAASFWINAAPNGP